MKYPHAIIGLCSCLVTLVAMAGNAAAPEHANKKVPGPFSVPFFIENINPTGPNVLRADFTLKQPAILDSFFISCTGAPSDGLLLIDGGPVGVAGTTGVGADPNVGLLVGLSSGREIPLTIDFAVSASGTNFFSPTHLGVPVNAKYSFIVAREAPNTLQCNGNAVFTDVE